MLKSILPSAAKKANLVICVILILSFLLTLAVTITARDVLEQALVHSSYYIILFLTIAWLLTIIKILKLSAFDPVYFLRTHRFGIICIILIALSIFCAVKPGYRVLSDETNLISMSHSMFRDKTIYNTTMALKYYDKFHPLSTGIEKRPFLYPFFVSILHSLIGYNYKNAFYCNGILLVAFLFLIYWCGKYFSNHTGLAITAVLLVAAQPIVNLCATSAGYEMLTLFFISSAFAGLYLYLQRSTAEHLLFLWLTLLMLSHVRYETILFLALFTICLVIGKKITWTKIKPYAPIYTLSLFAFLPRIWQSIVSIGHYENNDQPLFSIFHIAKNFDQLIKALYGFDTLLPYNHIINISGTFVLLVLMFSYMKKRLTLSKRTSIMIQITFLSSLAYVTIFLAHFFGIATHPTQFKFYLYPVVALSIMTFVGILMVPKIPRTISMVFALTLFCIYQPAAIQKEATNTLTMIRKTNAVYEFLEQLNDANILIIVDRPGQYTVLDRGAIDFAYANSNYQRLLNNLKDGLFSKIIVIQDIKKNPYREIEPLDQNYKLQPLKLIQHKADEMIRISEIIPDQTPTNI